MSNDCGYCAKIMHWRCIGTSVAIAACFLQGCNASPADVVDRAYNYMSYMKTMEYFEHLKLECPDIIETWIAQDAFPEILRSHDQHWGTCDGAPCKTLIVRIANKYTLTNSTPEVFFSGALHGDERIGPLVVTELAGFLCRQYKLGVEDVKRLVDTRSTWITPMTNAEGYANNNRHENGMDPNRDFPYLQNPSRCMMTQTARTVNELFRRHLFQFMITFHGGMRALTYEWGSRNHMVGSRSTESPDDFAFTSVGASMLSASGKHNGVWHYHNYGRITDVVYYVDGGMEDWSYGAGFEASQNPITVCTPKTYGGYAPDRTKYRSGSLSTLVYLAEMDNFKTAPVNSLGRTTEVWGNQPTDGHVPRNMRMCLKIMELARPEVIISDVSSFSAPLQPGQSLSIQIQGFGCITLNSAKLLLIPRSSVDTCSHLACRNGGRSCDTQERQHMLSSAHTVAVSKAPLACYGLAIWRPPAVLGKGIVRLAGVSPHLIGDFCAVVAAEFDQDWNHQDNPDPHVPPRSIAARSRVEEHYRAQASDGSMHVDEYKIKLFPVVQHVLRIGTSDSIGSTPIPSSSSSMLATRPEAGQTSASSTEKEDSTEKNDTPYLGIPAVILALVGAVVAIGICNTVDACRLRRQRVSRSTGTRIGHAAVVTDDLDSAI